MKKIVISYLFFLFLACCHWTGNICRAQSVFANPGTITGDQTIDANTQAQRIKNGVLPYCNVPYTFSWEYCWEDYYLSGFWSPIPGATSEYYDPGVVSRSTYYRRAINYTEGSVTKRAYSNEVLVKVRDAEITLTPGTISGNQTIESSTQPARLESVVAASVSSGFYTIMWQSAPASSGPWSDISGTSGSQAYQPGPLSATTYFRRTITSSTSKQASSNVVCVTIVTTSPGSISGNQKIEKGTQPTVLSNSTSPSFSGRRLLPFVGVRRIGIGTLDKDSRCYGQFVSARCPDCDGLVPSRYDFRDENGLFQHRVRHGRHHLAGNDLG